MFNFYERFVRYNNTQSFKFYMHTVRIPKVINFGKNALSETEYPKNALVVTTAPPDLSGKWLDKMGVQDYMVFDKVTPEPSIDDVKSLISDFKNKKPSTLIGLGGGSSMDVVKYAAQDFGVEKILIPTTFGTGAEMTTYCVLKFDGKKKLLHENRFLADMAVVDSYFMDGTPKQIINNSVCDACAQATEGYDSKLGHALSYVFSNEGVPHGYSLSSCTTVAHKFNKSIFYGRFKEAMEKLGFEKLKLKADVSEAADTVMTDKGHLDPNPIPIKKEDVIKCLEDIKAGNL